MDVFYMSVVTKQWLSELMSVVKQLIKVLLNFKWDGCVRSVILLRVMGVFLSFGMICL